MLGRGRFACVLAMALGAVSVTWAAEPPANPDVLAHLSPVAGKEDSRSVDLDIGFEPNAATLTEDGKAKLRQVGQALTAPAVADSLFGINGHTEATGSADFDRELSKRRAEAVKEFLVSEFKIDPKRLVPVGWGGKRPKNAAAATAPANRRIEIVNLNPVPAKLAEDMSRQPRASGRTPNVAPAPAMPKSAAKPVPKPAAKTVVKPVPPGAAKASAKASEPTAAQGSPKKGAGQPAAKAPAKAQGKSPTQTSAKGPPASKKTPTKAAVPAAKAPTAAVDKPDA